MSTPDDRRFAAELEAQRCRVHAAATTAAMERMRLDGWEPASRRPADDGVFAAELEAQRCRVRATAAEAEMEQMRLDNLERELLRRSGTAHSRRHSGPPHHRRAHTPPPPSPTPPSAQPPRSQGPLRPPHTVPRPPPRVEKEGRNIVFVVFRGTKVGLVNSMTEVNLRTEGFRGAVWQGYPDRESAGTAFTLASRARLTSTTSLPIGQLAVDVEAAPRPIRSRDLGNVQRLEARAWNDLWYVCFVGIRPGVYPTWIECAVNSKWVDGGDWKKFKTFEDARRAFRNATKIGLSRTSRTPSPQTPSPQTPSLQTPSPQTGPQ